LKSATQKGVYMIHWFMAPRAQPAHGDGKLGSVTVSDHSARKEVHGVSGIHRRAEKD